MKFTPHAPGTVVGPFVVVRCTHRGAHGKNTLYDVQWMCCGSVVSMSHTRINKAISHETKTCKPCDNKAKRSGTAIVPMIVAPPPSVKPIIPVYSAQGATDGHGWTWPSLGDMGPWWGLAEHLAKRGGIAKHAGERS